MEENITTSGMFGVILAGLDKRHVAIVCDVSYGEFENRLAKEQHVKLKHEVDVKKEDTEWETILRAMSEQNKSLSEAMKDFVKGSPDKKSMTQLTKAKQPPIWIGVNFERFRREVEAWNLGNKETDQDKFHVFMESLKKNNDVKEYVVMHILEKTTEQDSQTEECVGSFGREICEDFYREGSV
jgi:ribosomal protein L14E/L6E/L27E